MKNNPANFRFTTRKNQGAKVISRKGTFPSRLSKELYASFQCLAGVSFDSLARLAEKNSVTGVFRLLIYTIV